MQHHLTHEDIVNMDETMCRFDMVLGRTNDVIRYIRIVSTKALKKGFTVALAAKGNGEKLPALIIFKGLEYGSCWSFLIMCK